jgi:hypothetical protein
MRAREFIAETTRGKITARQQQPTVGLNKITDGDRWNSDYKVYRMGLALACTDGKTMPDVDFESWVGRWKTTHPYTQEEQDMLLMAYKATNVEYQDVNKGDLRSQELDSTNTVSPVANWMNKK